MYNQLGSLNWDFIIYLVFIYVYNSFSSLRCLQNNPYIIAGIAYSIGV